MLEWEEKRNREAVERADRREQVGMGRLTANGLLVSYAHTFSAGNRVDAALMRSA